MTNLPVAINAGPDSSLPFAVSAILDGMDVSENTRCQYRREIRVFLSWLGTASLHPNVLLDFKKTLKARNDIGAGTKAKYLSVARAFLRELFRLGALPFDLTANVKGIRVSRLHKRPAITDDEAHKVLAYLVSPDVDHRARLIITLMLFQGLRRVEIARLRVEDFDKSAKTLAVTGKGKDDAERVDLHPRTVEAIASYLKDHNLKSGPLFPSKKNPGHGLSSNRIWKLAMDVHRSLGFQDRNLHSWRKFFTTKLIRSGMSLPEVQGFTRHASLNMLQVYYNRLEKSKTLPAYYEVFA